MRATSLVLSVLVSAAMLTWAPAAHGQQRRARQRPNIVFIISDDHRWDRPDKPDELYDLVADPHETKNLAGEPSLRAVGDKLLRQLNAWMERTNDPARFWPKKTGKSPEQVEEARAEAELRAGLDDKTPVEFDPRVFDAYAGRYEFVTRITVAISKEGSRLFFTGEFGGKTELVPKSETEFMHPRLPMRFTFVKGEGGG
jgi:hypothetical protein